MTIAGRRGHQGFTALYSTQDGTDLSRPRRHPRSVARARNRRIKNSRYYFAWSFDQYLYQPAASPDEGVGLFGQFGDLRRQSERAALVDSSSAWAARASCRAEARDNWGIGYYYDGLSEYLKDALAPTVQLRDEQGLEIFYNLALTPWCDARRRPPGDPARAGERHRGRCRACVQ